MDRVDWTIKASLPVAEVFGPAYQGEGMQCGLKTIFLRLAGCDFQCSWCDTAYAQSVTAGTVKSISDIIDDIKRLAIGPSGELVTTWVTITGGNPVIHKNLEPLLWLLHAEGFKVAVETQGSIIAPYMKQIDCLCISPKPPSANMGWTASEYLVNIMKLKLYGIKNMFIKIPILDKLDFLFACEIRKMCPDIPMYLSACNVNLGEADDITKVRDGVLAQLQILYDMVAHDEIMHDVFVLPQQHVLVYGNKKEV